MKTYTTAADYYVRPTLIQRSIIFFGLLLFGLGLFGQDLCPADPCPCAYGLAEIELYYFGEDNVNIDVYRNQNQTMFITSFAGVNKGDLLTIQDPNGLGLYTHLKVTNPGVDTCTTRLYSSCPANAWPMSQEELQIIGQTVGDFTVFSYTDEGYGYKCDMTNGAAQDWHVGGNIVASPANTLGTRNAEDMVIISSDVPRGIVTAAGDVGIGTQTPVSPLEVAGVTTISDVTATASPADGALVVAGGVGIGQNVEVDNDANIGRDLNAANNATVGVDAMIGNDLTVGNDASVVNNAVIGQNLNVGNDANVTNDASVGNDATVGNDLSVAQNGDFGNDVRVGNDLQVDRNALVQGDLTVADEANIGGNTEVGGTLNTLGDIVGQQNLFINQNANIGNDLSVADEARVGNRMSIGPTGIPAGYRLSVDGNIICEELLVQLSNDWPDYVFAEGYQKPNLKAWEQHIKEKKHLPGIPSAAEVAAQGGIEVGETNRLLLEKIEQLTLLLIDQQAQIDALKEELKK